MSLAPDRTKRGKRLSVKIPFHASGISDIQRNDALSFPLDHIASLQFILLRKAAVNVDIQPAILIDLQFEYKTFSLGLATLSGRNCNRGVPIAIS